MARYLYYAILFREFVVFRTRGTRDSLTHQPDNLEPGRRKEQQTIRLGAGLYRARTTEQQTCPDAQPAIEAWRIKIGRGTKHIQHYSLFTIPRGWLSSEPDLALSYMILPRS